MNNNPKNKVYKILTTRNILIIVGILLAALYFTIDPAQSVWMPKCLFHTLTGWDCPGCGAQRMSHALLHLDFAQAWRANAMLLCVLPYIIFWLYIELTPRSNPSAAHYSPRFGAIRRALNSNTAIAIITLVLLSWTLLRNLL